MEKVKRGTSCECEDDNTDPLSFFQNSTPRALGVTPKQFETLIGGAEGNLPPNKLYALLERYQNENRNKEKIDRQKENEQQMGYKFQTVRKPTEEILRGAQLMYPNATQGCSASSMSKKSGHSTRKAKRGNIKFTDESPECRHYVPGSRSRANPVDVDEMEQHKRSLTYDFDDLEFPEEPQELPEEPAPASSRTRRYQENDATDIIGRGVCPPINQPRVPERFLRQRSCVGKVEQEDPEMQQIRGKGVWPQRMPRIPDRFKGPRPEPDPASCGCPLPTYQRIPDRFLPKSSQQRTLETYTGQETLPDRFLRPQAQGSLEYEECEQPQLCSFKPGQQRIPDRFMSHMTPPKRKIPKCHQGRSARQDSAEQDADTAYLSNYFNSEEPYQRTTDSDLDDDGNENSCAVEGTKPKYWF